MVRRCEVTVTRYKTLMHKYFGLNLKMNEHESEFMENLSLTQCFLRAQEVRTFQMDDSINENDEMDMSDDDYGLSSSSKRSKIVKPKKKVFSSGIGFNSLQFYAVDKLIEDVLFSRTKLHAINTTR